MDVTQIFKNAIGLAPKVHPVDRGLARRWTKQRLASIFPELRGDSRGLEAAYQALGLEPGINEADPSELVFEISVHREPEGWS